MIVLIILLSFRSEADREKFECIFESYKKLMLHKAWQILQDHMLAEDAVSEALLRIYRNLDKIEDPDSNRTIAFVVTIVRNVALTMVQKEKKNRAEEYDETLADDFDLEGRIISDLSTQNIYGLVDRLNEDLKSVFVLKYAYDMSHREIGRSLNISENNVTVRLHRARKKLSALLIREGYAVEENA